MKLDAAFWQGRYEEGSTGWDTGGPTTPLVSYIDQLTSKELTILIPGAGNAYEAEYLFKKGFRNVYVVDLASAPLQNLKQRVPEFPDAQLIQGDFFEIEETFDLIIEQTFFCAIDPTLRADYVKKAHELLNTGGNLVGVLWSVAMNEDHPPFGGSIKEYRSLFSDLFEIKELAPCNNSIKPRAGREVFINLKKV